MGDYREAPAATVGWSHLCDLPDGSLTQAEVTILVREIEALRDVVRRVSEDPDAPFDRDWWLVRDARMTPAQIEAIRRAIGSGSEEGDA